MTNNMSTLSATNQKIDSLNSTVSRLIAQASEALMTSSSHVASELDPTLAIDNFRAYIESIHGQYQSMTWYERPATVEQHFHNIAVRALEVRDIELAQRHAELELRIIIVKQRELALHQREIALLPQRDGLGTNSTPMTAGMSDSEYSHDKCYTPSTTADGSVCE